MTATKQIDSASAASSLRPRIVNDGVASKFRPPIGTTRDGCLVQDSVSKILQHKAKLQTRVVDETIKAFNNWSFKREQPSGIDMLSRVVTKATVHNLPVDFILYWGKGPRVRLASPDTACLDYLSRLANRVREVYAPGVSIRLIFTDTHAALNGHAPESTSAYFDAIDAAAQTHGFLTARLGDIVTFAREVTNLDAEEIPSGEVLAKLVACAAKWYRGEGSADQGAHDYHRMNMVEKRAIETAFPDAVFVTFNGSEFRDLFPAKMPIFYMYSLRRGVGVKPWFMSSDAGETMSVPYSGTAQCPSTPPFLDPGHVNP